MKNTTEKPLVTIYIPTYNRRELLERALLSVLNQTYKNIEVIVVDDCSTDGTGDYVNRISKEDSRVEYIRNKMNKGACFSRNYAIKQARGEFITGLDDDDYFLPDHIETYVDHWGRRSKLSIALYSNVIKMTGSGEMKKTRRSKFCTPEMLLVSNNIGNQVFTVTKSLQKIGGFDANFKAWQDLDCWYRLLSEYSGVAERTEDYTYIVDISHPHERITTSAIEKIFDSYKLFCEKHKLRKSEMRLLEMMLRDYDNKFPNPIRIMINLFQFPRIDVLKSSIVHMLKPVRIRMTKRFIHN
jgi:glycosyltransferase involved in cell wall biosynthesis